MSRIAEVFRQYGPEYLRVHGDRMLPSHRRALHDILDCRTQACGGHVLQCDHCARLHYAYHSCRNRSCPQCHGRESEKWLEARRSELLPVPYFHLVFTIPKELREIVRSHQRVLLSVLMRAAALSLMKLARDPRYVGGMIGIMSVLHTWTRALIYHPHVHCLVPGGALSSDHKSWLPARNGFLVPVIALSRLFRAKFMDLARKSLPEVDFPQSVWQKDWVVYAKPALQGRERVLQYLARYVRRIAITNRRILSIESGHVTFRYKDSRDDRWKTMTLPAEEFIRRYLLHVLPRGFHKVRFYGLLAPGNRVLLDWAQFLLLRDHQLADSDPGTAPDPSDLPEDQLPICPHCHIGRLILLCRIQPAAREPP